MRTGPCGSASVKKIVNVTFASASVAFRMHAASWLMSAGSGPVLRGGIHPSAITHCLRLICGMSDVPPFAGSRRDAGMCLSGAVTVKGMMGLVEMADHLLLRLVGI